MPSLPSSVTGTQLYGGTENLLQDPGLTCTGFFWRLSSLSRVGVQVEGGQQVEVLESRQTADPVLGHVQDPQTPQAVQAFHGLQTWERKGGGGHMGAVGPGTHQAEVLQWQPLQALDGGDLVVGQAEVAEAPARLQTLDTPHVVRIQSRLSFLSEVYAASSFILVIWLWEKFTSSRCSSSSISSITRGSSSSSSISSITRGSSSSSSSSSISISTSRGGSISVSSSSRRGKHPRSLRKAGELKPNSTLAVPVSQPESRVSQPSDRRAAEQSRDAGGNSEQCLRPTKGMSPTPVWLRCSSDRALVYSSSV
ncbi:hypothetical protein CRUP_017502 [Coryphaenoides rupestris]|nr:hypothetical protein CRUP_017502 [Coryphaenoides rupestris]